MKSTYQKRTSQKNACSNIAHAREYKGYLCISPLLPLLIMVICTKISLYGRFCCENKLASHQLMKASLLIEQSWTKDKDTESGVSSTFCLPARICQKIQRHVVHTVESLFFRKSYTQLKSYCPNRMKHTGLNFVVQCDTEQ